MIPKTKNSKQHPFYIHVETVAPAELAHINRKIDKLMALLDALQLEVERNTTVEQSAVVLLKGLKEKLDAAGTDPVKLKALSTQLGQNTDDLAAGVAANTPADVPAGTFNTPTGMPVTPAPPAP